jgi:hypothetical protein
MFGQRGFSWREELFQALKAGAAAATRALAGARQTGLIAHRL